MVETNIEEADDLKERYRRHYDKVFTFLDYEEVYPTNNASERDLRGSVIHRKVTNCFRSEWGACAYAAFKSIRDTARRTGENIVEKLDEVMEYSIPQLEQKLQASTLQVSNYEKTKPSQSRLRRSTRTTVRTAGSGRRWI